VSPTVLRDGAYRFFFFSREEPRMHIHVSSPDGEAKFWLGPVVALVEHHGLSPRDLRYLHTYVEEHRDEIERAWREHFAG
jgi:hypothetical protein